MLAARQRRHSSHAPSYGFPRARGPLAPGHALEDVVGPADPFTAGELGFTGLDPGHLVTNADVRAGFRTPPKDQARSLHSCTSGW